MTFSRLSASLLAPQATPKSILNNPDIQPDPGVLRNRQKPPSANRRTPPIFLLLIVLACALPLAAMSFAARGEAAWVIGLTISAVVYSTLQVLLVIALARWPVRWPQLPSQTVKAPTIAVVIPAWNEAVALPKTLATVFAQDDWPDAIIVADDGSTDPTIADLSALYDIDFQGIIGRSRTYPNLQLLAKPHSGKGDSINQAVALSDADIVLILDADTRLYPGSIRALRHSLMHDPSLSAVSGTLIPRCSNTFRGRWFQFCQRYEYARQHMWRLAWSQLNSTLIISGACSAFQRELLLEIGGFSADSWGEDYEIMYRMQRYLRLQGRPCRVMVQPDLCVETDAPETVYAFLRQRRRWAAGFLETLLQYRHMVGDRRFGILGCGYLIHNTLSIVTPFYGLVWLVAGALLYTQVAQTNSTSLAIVSGSLALSVLTSSLMIDAYREHFGRHEVSPIGAILDLLLRPILYFPIMALSHIWGYHSCLRRQKGW